VDACGGCTGGISASAEYPGLQRTCGNSAREAVTTRSLTHGLTVKELVVDQLLQLSTAASQSVAIHEAIKEGSPYSGRCCQAILAPTATRGRSRARSHALYVRLEELLATKGTMIQADPADTRQRIWVWASASDRRVKTSPRHQLGISWAMNPEFIQQHDHDETRIGRSETQRTLNEIATFAGGEEVVSAGSTESRGKCAGD